MKRRNFFKTILAGFAALPFFKRKTESLLTTIPAQADAFSRCSPIVISWVYSAPSTSVSYKLQVSNDGEYWQDYEAIPESKPYVYRVGKEERKDFSWLK